MVLSLTKHQSHLGSVLCPILFLLYINDISDNISFNMHLFADDFIIYHVIVSKGHHCVLQTNLEQLALWAQTWQMYFNVTKCCLMLINIKTNPSLFPYSMLNQPLFRVHHSKYLGVTINSKLSWMEHITLTVAKSCKTQDMSKEHLATVNLP